MVVDASRGAGEAVRRAWRLGLGSEGWQPVKIRTFLHGYGGGWEGNILGRRWALRIGRYQLALWRDYEPVFDLRAGLTTLAQTP